MTADPGKDTGLRELLSLGATVWRLMGDPSVPNWQKAIPVLALLYVLWPADLLPDPILGLGQLDDLAVLLVALRLFMALTERRATGAKASAGPAAGEPGTVDADYRIRPD